MEGRTEGRRMKGREGGKRQEVWLVRFCPDPVARLFLPPWLLQMWAPRAPTDSSPEGPPVCGDTRCLEPPAANDTWEGQCILFAPPHPGGRGTWCCLRSGARMETGKKPGS